MFLAGLGTFLCSKEYFVMEHDFFVGLGLFAVLGTVVKQVIEKEGVEEFWSLQFLHE